jgi:hypothetical protein
MNKGAFLRYVRYLFTYCSQHEVITYCCNSLYAVYHDTVVIAYNAIMLLHTTGASICCAGCCSITAVSFMQ